jgi:hypothetical protein
VIAVTAVIAATAASTAVQAYLLQGQIMRLALLIAAAAVYAESRRESPVSRWLRRHYGAVSGALLGALAGSFIAPFISPGIPLTPVTTAMPAVLGVLWLAIAFGILRHPGRASEDER